MIIPETPAETARRLRELATLIESGTAELRHITIERDAGGNQRVNLEFFAHGSDYVPRSKRLPRSTR